MLLLLALAGCVAPLPALRPAEPPTPAPLLARAAPAAAPAHCPLPSAQRFRGVRRVGRVHGMPVPHFASTLPDGCAVVSFSLDAEGRVVAPAIVLERPAGSGIGSAALTVVGRSLYAPGPVSSRNDRFFALTVVFRHSHGRLVFITHSVAHRRHGR